MHTYYQIITSAGANILEDSRPVVIYGFNADTATTSAQFFNGTTADGAAQIIVTVGSLDGMTYTFPGGILFTDGCHVENSSGNLTVLYKAV